MIQMRGIGRVILVVCLCCFSAAAFGYTTADVKRGEEMVTSKDYKGAIELLSGITKDFDFAAANPADAARAGMLLCDAYETNGQQGSDAYKAAVESTNVALVQVWASLRKQEPDVKKRLEKIARICTGHPQALAKFLKPTLRLMVASRPKAEVLGYLDKALSLYREVLASASVGKGVVDVDLLSKFGEWFATIEQPQRAIGAFNEVLHYASEEERDIRMHALFSLALQSHYANDPGSTIANGRRCLDLGLSGCSKQEVLLVMVWAYDEKGSVNEATETARQLIAGEESPEKKDDYTMLLGDICYHAKRYSVAAKVFGELAHSPRSAGDRRAQAAYFAGLCYRQDGRANTACTYMKLAAGACPDSEWAKKARGQLYIWGALQESSK